MKVFIIGATGFIGAGILAESLRRNHEVTAIVRNSKKIPKHANLTVVEGDATVPDTLAPLVMGQDVVISAFNPGKDETGAGARSIVDGVKRSGVKRLLIVGGAGTLEAAPGKRLVDDPHFPQEWKTGALRTADFLELLRAECELDWVFLSPAALIAPGERTEKYRVGGDQLLTGSDGQSRISIEDYAVAMLNEAEKPEHSRARFSVAY